MQSNRKKWISDRIVKILLAFQADMWLFLSGMVASLGANVFTSRALDDQESTMWLEFILFTASSASCYSAGMIRREIKETWKKGGQQEGLENGFLWGTELYKYFFYAILAFFLFIISLLIVLGWDFASFYNGVVHTITNMLNWFINTLTELLNTVNQLISALGR